MRPPLPPANASEGIEKAMAFRSVVVSISATTRELLLEAQAGDVDVWISSGGSGSGEDFHIGDDSVTDSDGLKIPGSGSQVFHSEVRPGDEIYGYKASGTANVRVLVRSA